MSLRGWEWANAKAVIDNRSNYKSKRALYECPMAVWWVVVVVVACGILALGLVKLLYVLPLLRVFSCEIRRLANRRTGYSQVGLWAWIREGCYELWCRIGIVLLQISADLGLRWWALPWFIIFTTRARELKENVLQWSNRQFAELVNSWTVWPIRMLFHQFGFKFFGID